MGYYDYYDHCMSNTYSRDRKSENYFNGRSSESREFNDYVNRRTTRILSDIFEVENSIDLNHPIYDKLMTIERIKDILEYKRFSLTSPQIYNIVYVYLTYSYNSYKKDKDKVKKILQNEVNYYKKEMEMIRLNKYSPATYRALKDESSQDSRRINSDVYF